MKKEFRQEIRITELTRDDLETLFLDCLKAFAQYSDHAPDFMRAVAKNSVDGKKKSVFDIIDARLSLLEEMIMEVRHPSKKELTDRPDSEK